jgi:hypothetical protein
MLTQESLMEPTWILGHEKHTRSYQFRVLVFERTV